MKSFKMLILVSEDILIDIYYLIRPLVTKVRGKPYLEQEQIFCIYIEGNVARMILRVTSKQDK